MNAIKDLGLSWALFGLYVVLKASSLLPTVSRELQANNFSMVFKTGPGKTVRHYTISKGRVNSGKKEIPDPDLSISWSSASSCLDTSMAVLRGDRSAPLREILDGNLAIEGDVGQLFQFAKTLAPIGKKIPAEKLKSLFGKTA
ncbi:MAG: hypothetical protein JEZ02_02290 [Desulfatibacillum sp.]|nr:hypothetical protein [Desulfatibacillum sp.]